MPNTIHCPSCNRELRVPDELLGKKVKCPACSQTFTATVAGPEAAPPRNPEGGQEPMQPSEPRPLAPRESSAEEGRGDDLDRPLTHQPTRDKQGLAGLRAPAICLLVSAVLGLLGSGYYLVSTALVPREVMEKNMKQFQTAKTPEEQKMQKQIMDLMIGPAGILFHAVFIFINLIIILGSIMMLLGKMRWLALTASILAMLNIDCCCCLLGLPFGIWSLVALNNPKAKDAFD
jgi:predicted Zn finger-like uncharacterized protein